MKKKSFLIDIDYIEKEFTNIIREKMTSKEFWKWVSTWKDSYEICSEAEDGWSIEDKMELIKEYHKK